MSYGNTSLSDSELLHIYVEVADGRGGHGDFLKSFAQAVMRADHSNFSLLRAPAALIELKYGLRKYLDNFTETA